MDKAWKTFGHQGIKGILEQQLDAEKLSHAYLFSGPGGIGKKTLAIEFAARILAADNIAAHPDFLMLDQTEEISVEQIRDFIARLSLKPLAAKHKVAIINNAELLNTQSGNALLKTLEEPSESTILILVGDGARLLSTIRSRCLKLTMQGFSLGQLRDFAKSQGLKVSDDAIALSFGSSAHLISLAGDSSLLSQKQKELERWRELKRLGAGQRLLSIAEYADLEAQELAGLLETWLYGEEQTLRTEPKNFLSVAALKDAVIALRTNQNKKSILQSLFLRI